MREDQETYTRLKEYSDKLYENGKSIWNEDKEAARKLNSFGIIIEENLLWNEKDQFIALFKDFIYGTLSAYDFSFIFGARYFDIIREKNRELEIDLKKNSYQSGEVLELIINDNYYKDYIRKYSDILGEAEALTEDFRVDPEVGSFEIGEEQLRNFAEKALFKIQELINESKK
jgi:hypothetical protein